MQTTFACPVICSDLFHDVNVFSTVTYLQLQACNGKCVLGGWETLWVHIYVAKRRILPEKFLMGQLCLPIITDALSVYVFVCVLDLVLRVDVC